jgi:Protein of unknown function (DUF5672)
MRTSLPEVTLCAVDCVYPTLTGRAIAKSLEQCAFADAILFTDAVVSGPFRVEIIPAIQDRWGYSQFILKKLASHVATPLALLIQWDGFVISGRHWKKEFGDYDYIGAQWPWYTDAMKVGNGGFSLRSRRLLERTAEADFQLPQGENEDHLICRIRRPELEAEQGIRFAPVAVADQFSYECAAPERQTFGFHGLFNLWRHVDDAEMVSLVKLLKGQTMVSRQYYELLAEYLSMRKFSVASEVARRLHEENVVAPFNEHVRKLISPAAAEAFFRQLQELGLV